MAAAASLALAWPGVALYDTVRQFDQLRTGTLDDWHPPVMARLWQAFLAAGAAGTAPLFVVQTLAFYAGLALLFAALPRLRPALAVAMLVALVIPADWLTVVVKDAQMVAALTLATGVVAAFRLRARALPGWAVAVVAGLLGYATLVRANAVFAVVPLAVAWWMRGSVAARLAVAGAATLAVLALSPVVNHHLLGASVSHVERVLPVFDLAGIAHFGGPLPPRVDPAAWREAEQRGCYSPALWDAFGDDHRCGFIGSDLGLQGANGAALLGEWLRAVATNPVPYARHRLGHLNATLRWLVPLGQPNAGAPPDSQPNLEGLGGGGTWRTRVPARVARTLAATPLGWPAAWLAASLGLWATAAATPRSPPRDLALALFVSASAISLSFAAVSIASDLRYHVWAIVATALGGALLGAAPGVPRSQLTATALAVAIVAAIGIVARTILPTGAWG